VSIITAWNSQKDKINELGGQRFAHDTSQTLEHQQTQQVHFTCRKNWLAGQHCYRPAKSLMGCTAMYQSAHSGEIVDLFRYARHD